MEMPVCFQHKTYLNKYIWSRHKIWHINNMWVSTTSSSLHSLKCKCCMILVRPNVLGVGGLVFCFFTICLWCHFFNRCTKKRNGIGWKLMWRGRTVLNDVRKENMSLCTPLQPWGITQLDFRLFFPLLLPIWFLLLPDYSLSSALFLCIVIM